MSSFLTEYLVIFQNLTLPGFLYLVGILFLFQSYTSFRIANILKTYKDYIFYIGVLTIIISFILGFIVFLALQQIKTLLFDKYFNGEPYSSIDISVYNNMYGVLIMIRHLIISTAFLICSVIHYMRKEDIILNHKRFYITIYLIFSIILSLSYFKMKEIIDLKTCGTPIKDFWIILGCFAVTIIPVVYIFLPDIKNKFIKKNYKQ